MAGRRAVGQMMAACLIGMLLVLLAPVAQAVNLPYIAKMEKLFPLHTSARIANGRSVLLFNADNYLCLAVPDKSDIVRYVFILPSEKGKTNSKIMAKAKPMAEKLHAYLNKEFGDCTLIPFEDNESGYVIDMTQSIKSFSTPYILGAETIKALAFLTRKGAAFYKCDDGVVTMHRPCESVSGENATSFSPCCRTA